MIIRANTPQEAVVAVIEWLGKEAEDYHADGHNMNFTEDVRRKSRHWRNALNSFKDALRAATIQPKEPT